MMIEETGARFVPIGCSCINQFQLQYAFASATMKTGLFDWTICAPSTTLAILDLEAAGDLRALLSNADAYGLDRGIGHVVHRDLPGLYFWHEDRTAVGSEDGRRRLAEKVVHLTDNIFASTAPTHFVWSNLQPNLKAAVEGGTTLPWHAFTLTEEVRGALRQRLDRRFPHATVSFVTRAEDCAETLPQHGDVHVFDVPRSPDYEGAPGLYAPVFAALRSYAAAPVNAA